MKRRPRRAALILSGAAVTTALLASSSTLWAEEVQERHPPSSIRIKLISGGLGVAGGAYAIGMAVKTYSPDVPGSDALVIPVAGPWIALVQNECPPDDLDCGAVLHVRGVLLALEGVVQLAGLALVGEGIFLKTEKSRDSALTFRYGGVTMSPTPMTPKNGVGLGISGTF